MVFTAPAVHYSALATLPLELPSSKCHHSTKQTDNIRLKLNRIFKKILDKDTHHEQTTENEINNEKILYSSITDEKHDDDNILTIVKKSTNDITKQETQECVRSLTEPFECLPFTESYNSKTDKFPLDLPTYHKNCIHQQKSLDYKQDQDQSSSSITTIQLNRFPLKSIKQYFDNHQLENFNAQECQNQVNQQKSNLTKTLSVSTSVENHIGLKYASRRNIVTNKHSIRSSYEQQQQTQHLRRLQSKLRIHSRNVNDRKSISEKNLVPRTFVSSSIAHRIELLKQAMHNNQVEFHSSKSHKSSTIQLSSYSSLIDKETQTNDNQLKSSDIYHIHHHIHSSSIEWRTYLSIMGTILIIFLLLIQLITIIL